MPVSASKNGRSISDACSSPGTAICMQAPARRRFLAASMFIVRGAANLSKRADRRLKFLLVAAPRRYQHHPTPEWPTPCRCRSRAVFSVPVRPARTCAGPPETSRDLFGHEHIWRLVTERRTLLSKGRVVTRPLADGRRLTKSGGGTLFFPALQATTLAGRAMWKPLHRRRKSLSTNNEIC
jgi:hypothetical protein